MSEKIFAINPGSTSTKIALFEGDNCVFKKNVAHDAAELASFGDMAGQLPYRRDMILSLLKENNISLEGTDVFVGRGGGLMPSGGGTYEITPLVLEHARTCANGVVHPATLGPQLAHALAEEYHAKAMVVNPPDTDELQDVARVTGIRGVYRTVHLHALNLKETAIRHSSLVMHRRYDECSYVVCHIGGGISVSAHKNGRMIDGFDIVGGEGPMAPTRCGGISVYDLLDYMEKNHVPPSEVRRLCTGTGGFVSHLGISDGVEVSSRAGSGDRVAKLVWDAMIYQIIKGIGAMACALEQKPDGILLGGGMVHNQELVERIRTACGFIAPVTAYPGEFEMEAMAAGAVRVLRGEEALQVYTGEPVFRPFTEASGSDPDR